MDNQLVSQIITYPSTVDKSTNTTVLLIDASTGDIENVGLFCKVSKQNYDVYLYRHSVDDLQWLSEVSNRAEYIFIDENSSITAPSTSVKFGIETNSVNLLEQFQKIDNN